MKNHIALLGVLTLALSSASAFANCNDLVESAVRKQVQTDLKTSDFSLGVSDVYAGNASYVSSVQVYDSTAGADPELTPAVIANYEVSVQTNDELMPLGSLSENCTILKITRLN